MLLLSQKDKPATKKKAQTVRNEPFRVASFGEKVHCRSSDEYTRWIVTHLFSKKIPLLFVAAKWRVIVRPEFNGLSLESEVWPIKNMKILVTSVLRKSEFKSYGGNKQARQRGSIPQESTKPLQKTISGLRSIPRTDLRPEYRICDREGTLVLLVTGKGGWYL